MPAKEKGLSPVELAAKIIGNKWKLLIVQALLKKEPLRFTQLEKAVPDISKKVLTECLRVLEEDKILVREAFGEVPPRVEYSLTEQGRALAPVLDAMHDWGKGYIDGEPAKKRWRFFKR